MIALRMGLNSHVYYYLQDPYIEFSLSNLQPMKTYNLKIDLMEVLNDNTLQLYIPQVNYHYNYTVMSAEDASISILILNNTFHVTTDNSGNARFLYKIRTKSRGFSTRGSYLLKISDVSVNGFEVLSQAFMIMTKKKVNTSVKLLSNIANSIYHVSSIVDATNDATELQKL